MFVLDGGGHAGPTVMRAGGGGEGGEGGGLMISCFSSGALPQKNWSDYQQHLVVITIITHPCENSLMSSSKAG